MLVVVIVVVMVVMVVMVVGDGVVVMMIVHLLLQTDLYTWSWRSGCYFGRVCQSPESQVCVSSVSL